jgi:hypothetical protein
VSSDPPADSCFAVLSMAPPVTQHTPQQLAGVSCSPAAAADQKEVTALSRYTTSHATCLPDRSHACKVNLPAKTWCMCAPGPSCAPYKTVASQGKQPCLPHAPMDLGGDSHRSTGSAGPRHTADGVVFLCQSMPRPLCLQICPTRCHVVSSTAAAAEQYTCRPNLGLAPTAGGLPPRGQCRGTAPAAGRQV